MDSDCVTVQSAPIDEPAQTRASNVNMRFMRISSLPGRLSRHSHFVRGGTHHFRLPSSWSHDHPFRIIPRDRWPHPWPRPEVTDREITLAGELCTPKDVLAREVTVQRVRVGDLVCFQMAGAYGWDISHHDFLCHAHPERLFLSEGERAAA